VPTEIPLRTQSGNRLYFSPRSPCSLFLRDHRVNSLLSNLRVSHGAHGDATEDTSGNRLYFSPCSLFLRDHRENSLLSNLRVSHGAHGDATEDTSGNWLYFSPRSLFLRDHRVRPLFSNLRVSHGAHGDTTEDTERKLACRSCFSWFLYQYSLDFALIIPFKGPRKNAEAPARRAPAPRSRASGPNSRNRPSPSSARRDSRDSPRRGYAAC
jgi:hypothetical protein